MWSAKVFTETIDNVIFELIITEAESSLEDNFDDKEMIKLIKDKVNSGDWFAWFDMELKASFFEVHESTYIGCCSYENLEDFMKDHYIDMKEDVLYLLNANLVGLKPKLDKYLETHK